MRLCHSSREASDFFLKFKPRFSKNGIEKGRTNTMKSSHNRADFFLDYVVLCGVFSLWANACGVLLLHFFLELHQRHFLFVLKCRCWRKMFIFRAGYDAGSSAQRNQQRARSSF
jgi:hypothetical protein